MPVTIDKPSSYFNTVLYTGNGTTNAITGVGFKPDFVWLKSRSNAYGHAVYDNVRGATKYLYPNLTNAEATNSTTLQSFDTDGFTLGANENSNQTSGITAVSWNWLGANTTASNNSGTITSTVSANTTSGFSIVSFTGNATAGATVGHGLGVAPSMIIIKNRSISNYWGIYHKSITASNILVLNATDASASSDLWNYTTPTSSVFTLGNVGPNASGNSIIAYCFAEIKGYSRFGSYTGNGSTDGPFIYTGFKPAFLIAKRTSSTGNWRTRDNKRSNYNAVELVLNPNLTATDTTEDPHDFLSNGFKIRTSGPENNSSGGTFIYMAFAENPFVSSKGIPTTAR